MKNSPLAQPFQTIVPAAGDKDLTSCDPVKYKLLPPSVQLAEHIVQQQYGPLPGVVKKDLPAAKLQGKGRCPGLSLGGVDLGLQSV